MTGQMGDTVFQEHDTVELLVDLPERGVRAGDTGTVVHVFSQPSVAYEVEFSDEQGETMAMCACTSDQLRLVQRRPFG